MRAWHVVVLQHAWLRCAGQALAQHVVRGRRSAFKRFRWLQQHHAALPAVFSDRRHVDAPVGAAGQALRNRELRRQASERFRGQSNADRQGDLTCG